MTSSARSGTPVLRQLNTIAVLNHVRSFGPTPMRITELMELSGLARPTVAQVIDDLVKSGRLEIHHPGSNDRSIGRPASRITLNSHFALSLALDIGPHRMTAAIADLYGRQLAVVRRRRPGRTPGALRSALSRLTDEVIGSAGVDPTSIAAVVAASPGIVDPDSYRTRLAPSIPGWRDVDIAAHLTEHVGAPAIVENDANLAALAVSGLRGDAGTILAVQWGERIGAGIVIDGRLHRGGNSAAGEIGFIHTAESGPITSPEGHGSLEHAIGSTGIVERAQSAAAAWPQSSLASLLLRDPVPATVFTAAAAGDPAALEVANTVAGIFASAVSPVLLALDPDALIIGGGVARAGAPLLDAIRREVSTRVLAAPAIEFSALAEDTVLVGAIRMATDHAWAAHSPTL